MDRFTRAYIECALWSSTDDTETPLDENYGPEDLSAEALATMQADCEAFQAGNSEDLENIAQEQAGHDFWLTRNGHGAGFWDRGLGDVGGRLTDACKPYGCQDIYVGDDGILYV